MLQIQSGKLCYISVHTGASSLGVLTKCENKGEDMVDILHYAHRYVAKVSDEVYVPILFGGDQLTRERAYHAQELSFNHQLPWFLSVRTGTQELASIRYIGVMKNRIDGI